MDARVSDSSGEWGQAFAGEASLPDFRRGKVGQRASQAVESLSGGVR
jgi:hypothetical protein